MSFINNKSPDVGGACRGTFSQIRQGNSFNKRPSDVPTDVYMDVRTDVYMDVYMDVRTESRNALDALKSKISPLRFRFTEREVWSSNISRVMGGSDEIILINVQNLGMESAAEVHRDLKKSQNDRGGLQNDTPKRYPYRGSSLQGSLSPFPPQTGPPGAISSSPRSFSHSRLRKASRSVQTNASHSLSRPAMSATLEAVHKGASG